MARNLSYLLSLLPGIVAIAGNVAGGWWSASNIVFSLVILGLLEYLAGSNHSNAHTPSKDPFPAFVLFLHVPVHLAVLISLFNGISSGTLSGATAFLAIWSSGLETGSGATVVAHELIHKANPLMQFCGRLLLALCGNFYFRVHHLQVHHKYVGTEIDAATARRGESVHAFFTRTVRQQFMQAWQSERKRLMKRHGATQWLLNGVIQDILCVIFALGFVLLVFGPWSAAAFLMVAFVGSFLLEYVNYIEHYGLQRMESQKVDHTHSWNCDKVISRFFLVDLSRHADHHFHASKSYHTLNTSPESPVLPGGYVSMVIPALIPPLWFSIVHPILDSRKNRT